MWIQKLYERYPPDANNDWTTPSTELGQQVRKELNGSDNMDAGSGLACAGPSKFESGLSTRTRESSGTDDVEYEEGVLPQLHPILVHHLPSMPVPVGYIADLRRRRARGSPLRYGSEGDYRSDDDNDGDVDVSDNDDEVGVAHSKYFNPGPASDIDQRRFYIEREPVPDILLHGLITLDDVDELFKMYVLLVIFRRKECFSC